MDLNQIAFQNPATNVYLHDPSIVRLDSGELTGLSQLPRARLPPKCQRIEECLTSLYLSRDSGQELVVPDVCELLFRRQSVHAQGLRLSARHGQAISARSAFDAASDGGRTRGHVWHTVGGDPAQTVGSAEEALENVNRNASAGDASVPGWALAKTLPTTTAPPCRSSRAKAESIGHSRTVRQRTGPAFTPIPRSEECRRL